jgi:hypothetical protein
MLLATALSPNGHSCPSPHSKSTTIQDLPPSSYPVSCQPRLTSLKISRQQEDVVTPTSTQPQENFENFLYSQEPWILDLLRRLEFKVSFDEAITSLTALTTTNLGASDGSVKFENRTWGWVRPPQQAKN